MKYFADVHANGTILDAIGKVSRVVVWKIAQLTLEKALSPVWQGKVRQCPPFDD